MYTTEDTYEQAEAVEIGVDMEMAARMREELAKCEHVVKDFRRQEQQARSRADAAERCAGALQKALNVLDPPEKQRTVTSDSIGSQMDPSAYRNV